MGDFIYSLLALKYSQICKCYVLRARVGGNANVLSQILCLGSTKKFKDTGVHTGVNTSLPRKQEEF